MANFLSKCLVCQQVKESRQKPAGLLQPLSGPECKLTKSAHFIPEKSTYTTSKWAQLYLIEIVRLHGVTILASIGTRSPVYWDEVGEQRLMDTELVQFTNEAIQKIKPRTQAAHSRQKSYADVRWKDLEFDVGDNVFLKVAPMKDVLQFKKKGKKYVTDPSHVVDYEPLKIDENLSYAEQPVEILARGIKMLRNKGIALVKVLWWNYKVEEATWEREDGMRARYPELFEDKSSLRREECNAPKILRNACLPSQSSSSSSCFLNPSLPLFSSHHAPASSHPSPPLRKVPQSSSPHKAPPLNSICFHLHPYAHPVSIARES
ncbi:DNA/RNA polymerases superfamily protein [Cucumis melo var. makuwa]|uniref:DNA/RNA polymerases superfamily protein n=1 Tax=Cucumis melo var. makuwa TaxID=1194695 RepID=A0A5D3CGM5_CUCMM|nr:DNA/RNA polymerases superfamily protein [Cucumis melo var. makuwa]